MRTLIDVPEDDIKWLDQRALSEGKSRAAVVREAVSAYRIQTNDAGSKDWLEAGFGGWARLGMEFDAHEYERKRRAEWTRPWDDNYDDVRAQSPDCFDDYDDRERAHYLSLRAAAEARGDGAA